MVALNPADYAPDPATLAQFKTALQTVAGGIITADVALITISAQRTKPLLHTDYLVISLVLGSLSMILVLLSLAQLNFGNPLLGTFRRLALTTCLLAFLPLLLFTATNFAPGNSTTTLAADLFGTTLDAPIAKQLRHPVKPDPGLQALLKGDSLNPPLDEKSGAPILNRQTSPIGALARRVAQPLYTKDGVLPGSTEVDHGVDQRLVGELLAVRTELSDLHHNFLINETQAEPWISPELYELQIFIYSEESRLADWKSEEEAKYLPVYHDYFRDLIVRFVLFASQKRPGELQPLGQDLPTGDDAAWTAAFDRWFFGMYSPPPSLQYGLDILALPLADNLLDHADSVDAQLLKLLSTTPPDSGGWGVATGATDPSTFLLLGNLSHRTIAPHLAAMDHLTPKNTIERTLVQQIANDIVAAGPAFLELHRANHDLVTLADSQTQPELADFYAWLFRDEMTFTQWDRSSPQRAASLLLTWMVQLQTRFALYITDNAARQAEFAKLDAARWDAAYRTWFMEEYLPEINPPGVNAPVSGVYPAEPLGDTAAHPDPIFIPSTGN